MTLTPRPGVQTRRWSMRRPLPPASWPVRPCRVPGSRAFPPSSRPASPAVSEAAVRRAGRASRVSTTTGGRTAGAEHCLVHTRVRPPRRVPLRDCRCTTRQPGHPSSRGPGPEIQMARKTGSKDDEDPARNLDTAHSIPPDPTTCRDQAMSIQSSAGTYCERCFGLVVAIITPVRSRVAACAARITSPSRAGVWCGWPSLLTCLGPERGGLTHCRGCYGKESDLRDECVEPCDPGSAARPDEFTPQLVIGDFRDQDRGTAVNRIHNPAATGRRHRRRPGIRDQAKWTAVEQDGAVHQLRPLNSLGKSFRTESRSWFKPSTRWLIVSRCSPPSCMSAHERISAPTASARSAWFSCSRTNYASSGLVK